jgi:hypothetical protein
MKQTAVDWFVKEVELISNSKRVSREEMIELYNQAIKQAKEMEKEQMIEFANSFYDDCVLQYGGLEQSSEQYYNDKYNTETK